MSITFEAVVVCITNPILYNMGTEGGTPQSRLMQRFRDGMLRDGCSSAGGVEP
jgi:hypothetical protein